MPRTTYRLGSDGVTWVALPPVDEQSRQSVADWEAHLGRQGTTFEPFTGESGTELAYQVMSCRGLQLYRGFHVGGV